jgi:hypothetical protein
MRKLAVIAAISCIMPIIHAQKIIEKTINFDNKKSLVLDLQITDSIHIQTWNKNEVYAYAIINVNDNKDNDAYKTSFDDSDNRVEIKAKFEDQYFKGKQCNNEVNVAWKLMIPETAELTVKTINGNIIIVGKSNSVKAHTISGFIDMGLEDGKGADLNLKTITGNIYTDLSLANLNKRIVELKINEKLNGGGVPVNLETISGDIFLRKK